MPWLKGTWWESNNAWEADLPYWAWAVLKVKANPSLHKHKRFLKTLRILTYVFSSAILHERCASNIAPWWKFSAPSWKLIYWFLCQKPSFESCTMRKIVAKEIHRYSIDLHGKITVVNEKFKPQSCADSCQGMEIKSCEISGSCIGDETDPQCYRIQWVSVIWRFLIAGADHLESLKSIQ